MKVKEYKLPNGKIAAFEYDESGVGKVTLECMDELMAMIADRPQGEWKVRGNPKRNLWECSLCRCTIYSESESDRNKFHKWCGRCGARMKGADDE